MMWCDLKSVAKIKLDLGLGESVLEHLSASSLPPWTLLFSDLFLCLVISLGGWVLPALFCSSFVFQILERFGFNAWLGFIGTLNTFGGNVDPSPWSLGQFLNQASIFSFSFFFYFLFLFFSFPFQSLDVVLCTGEYLTELLDALVLCFYLLKLGGHLMTYGRAAYFLWTNVVFVPLRPWMSWIVFPCLCLFKHLLIYLPTAELLLQQFSSKVRLMACFSGFHVL